MFPPSPLRQIQLKISKIMYEMEKVDPIILKLGMPGEIDGQ